ncbi:MAG: thioredoxin [Phycisphaerales bacterium]
MSTSPPLNELTDDSFAETIETTPGVAMVEFWASWCMPCRMLEPVIREIASNYGPRIVVGQVDTDRHRDTARRFEVNAVPTVIIFQDGSPVQRFIGLTSFEKLAVSIDRALAASDAARSGAAG